MVQRLAQTERNPSGASDSEDAVFIVKDFEGEFVFVVSPEKLDLHQSFNGQVTVLLVIRAVRFGDPALVENG